MLNKKIRTKAMGTTGGTKLNDSMEIAESSANNSTDSTEHHTSSSSPLPPPSGKINKELQFLQAAIGESGLISDLFHTFQMSSHTPTATATPSQPSLLLKSERSYATVTSSGAVIQHEDALALEQHEYQHVLEVSEAHMDTVLHMQSELVEQQKELRSIESETMEQLKLLHANIGKLAKKFDSFEVVISGLNGLTGGGPGDVKPVKTNGSAHQIKVQI